MYRAIHHKMALNSLLVVQFEITKILQVVKCTLRISSINPRNATCLNLLYSTSRIARHANVVGAGTVLLPSHIQSRNLYARIILPCVGRILNGTRVPAFCCTSNNTMKVRCCSPSTRHTLAVLSPLPVASSQEAPGWIKSDIVIIVAVPHQSRKLPTLVAAALVTCAALHLL